MTRDELLRATVRVIAKDGLPRLMLEAVVRAAGVSKGRLLYHFLTKEALIGRAGAVEARASDAGRGSRAGLTRAGGRGHNRRLSRLDHSW